MPLQAAHSVGTAEVENVTAQDESRAISHIHGLVLRAQAGDVSAFEQLMVLYQRRVLGTATRILRRREDARDAAQEVFLRLYRHLPRIRAEAFRTWLYRVTVNVCSDMAKKSEKYPSLSLEENAATLASDGPGAGQIEAGMVRTERLRVLHDALRALPFKERSALVLRDVEGLSTEDTARALGSSATTVRSQISSARVKVRAYCERAMGLAK